MTTEREQTNTSEANQDPPFRSIGFSKIAGVSLACSLVTAIAVQAAATWAEPKQVIAQIDIANVLEAKEYQLMEKLMNPSLSRQEKDAMLEALHNFSGEVQKQLDIIKDKCGCLLLTKGAVVSGGVPDYTADVKEALSLASVNVEAIRAKIAANAPQIQIPGASAGSQRSLPSPEPAKRALP